MHGRVGHVRGPRQILQNFWVPCGATRLAAKPFCTPRPTLREQTFDASIALVVSKWLSG
jgi:hypothetical protein